MATLKDEARAIFDAAVSAADPAACVRRAMEKRRYYGPVVVVGAGKASVRMARAIEELVPQAEGVVVTPYGYSGPTKSIRVREAGHPIPDEAGLTATNEIIGWLDGRPVIVLLSGGASALLTAPADGLTLSDLRETSDVLLRSGATIADLNCVRKHLSRVKGGRLAVLADAPTLGLILSDVVGDPLDVIGSGPTAPDPTTFRQALSIVEGRSIPDSVRRHLETGAEETPKPGHPIFRQVENLVIGNNRLALEGAKTRAESLGYRVEIGEGIRGEARKVGLELGRRLADLPPKTCYLAGGEPTVTVTGSGRGGRAQELALSAASVMNGSGVLLAAGTDGRDGETDAAGAVVDRAHGDEAAFLDNNDSHAWFRKHGGHVITGPTGTNVMDIVVLLQPTV